MGKDKINNNDFMKDLSDLMENEQFSNFFKKYMTDWDTLKCTTIYMRLYSEFKDKYKEISGKKLDKHIIIYLLSKIMTDNILRPFTIETIKKVQEENNKVDFFDEFEDFLKTTCLN
jgi:hypothetical protein|tara:strand:- start:21 stop:368 length:348 start_codon:yes stop_codon:yes gene_type:complete